MSKYKIAVISNPINYRKIREEIALILADKSDSEFEKRLEQIDTNFDNTLEIPKIKILKKED